MQRCSQLQNTGLRKNDNDIINSDDVIKEIGMSIYNTRKPTKGKKARIKNCAATRLLGKLMAATEGVEMANELFLVHNYYALENATSSMKSDKITGRSDGCCWHPHQKCIKYFYCGPYF